MKTPKKILFVNEASYIASGFGNYGKELIPRIIEDGTFHIAEFATYAKVNDKRDGHINWRFYPNAVDRNDSRYKDYMSRKTNAFGEWRFERVLLDYKPDVVFSIADPWMFAYQCFSPYRDFYNWTIMPTYDSAPAKDEWIEMYRDADGVFTYTDWAQEELKKQGHNKINLQGVPRMGVDIDVFKPVINKGQHKQSLDITPDTFIVGTVMRNQKRKLFPDLFEAFRIFLDNADPDIAQRTYLYVHTSYPDRGWPIPDLLKEFQLSNKVLFTYICKATHRTFCSFFQDARTYSPFSDTASGVLPSTSDGVSRQDLAAIYNLFDVYIQYATCEGLGVPQIEAAACGVPIMSVDYSAMSDLVKQTGGIPLRVERMFRELETYAYRAYPDNKYCAAQIEKFLKLSDEQKNNMGDKARQAIKKLYSWDTVTAHWLNYFSSVELTGLQGQWDAPMRQYNIETNIPQHLSNTELVHWLCKNVVHKPERAYGLLGLDSALELNYGARISLNDIKEIKRQDIIDSYIRTAKTFQHCEAIRCGKFNLAKEDYIEYAHLKEQ
jgi:glycosyltransferase involved in cell wall biosynthesis